MISMIQVLPVGNALRVYLAPPSTALAWTVLRNTTGVFSGYNDPTATQVYQGAENTVMDFQGLSNGTTYYYGVFYYDGTAWTAGNVVSAVPGRTYTDQTIDVLSLVRDRVDYGLQAEVLAGTLTPQQGVIKVLTAPPLFEETQWPVVTVHLQSEGPQERGLGELIESDFDDKIAGQWDEFEGWLASVQIAIVGYTLNPDERIAVRQALRRIILANLPVFDAAGMVHIDFQQQDTEDMQSFNAPVYFSMGTFSCLAPVRVADTVAPITDAQVSVNNITVIQP